MLRRTACAALILLVMLPLAKAQQHHLWGEELQPILQLIDPPGLSASLQLEGHSDPTRLPPFPNFRTTANKTGSTLQTIRNIVSPDRGMRVSQDEDGTIRMKDKGVPADILNVRISHVSFDSYGRKGIYSANAAVQIIMATAEAVAFLNEHDIPWGANRGIGSGIGFGSPPPGRPHLIEPLDNVTVFQAFDRVLQSFRGEVLVYWNCPATRKDKDPRPAKTAEVWKPSAELFSNCSINSAQGVHSDSLPANLPNPFCLPLRAFQGLTIPSVARHETSHQRRVYFQFFSLRKFGERMLVASG
jgi:hypothetical protein